MDYHDVNRLAWTRMAPDFAESGRRCWAASEPTWGVFGVPESNLRLLPDDLKGKRTIELGCGTAYVSAWLARRGAAPVGIDLTPAQLDTAHALQQEFGIQFPLVQGAAESMPFEDESFDFAISEYGASIWCDPYLWIPEAYRVLRPGAELVFLTNGLLQILTLPGPEGEPSTNRLQRDYFGLHRLEWEDGGTPSVEFHLGFGDWVRLLTRTGFVVEDFVEIRPEVGSATDFEYVTVEWARRWPAEQAWRVRRV